MNLLIVNSIDKRAYEMLRANFRARAKKKLLSSKRGVWSGKLLNSIDIEITETDDEINIAVLAEDYLEFIDEGVNGTERNNGSKYSYKSKKPPIKEISLWAKSKGLNPYAVQNSIYTKGIKGIHFFEDFANEFMRWIVFMRIDY